ncbi:hypothetical protein ACIBI9_56300 [Nonomuraea sp. NPDC050451]|uniref:hypothetical protein n=1 Tax=Nonomuraea sp. NPDC050451 TaxID=3364364 RepID=UPI0037930E76
MVRPAIGASLGASLGLAFGTPAAADARTVIRYDTAGILTLVLICTRGHLPWRLGRFLA